MKWNDRTLTNRDVKSASLLKMLLYIFTYDKVFPLVINPTLQFSLLL